MNKIPTRTIYWGNKNEYEEKIPKSKNRSQGAILTEKINEVVDWINAQKK